MEEDIKILENAIKEVEDNKDIGFFKNEEDLKFYNAVKHLLKAYENLKQENEYLKLKERNRIHGRYGEIEVHDLINKILSKDYVSKDKIAKIIITNTNKLNKSTNEILKRIYKARIELCKELLEGDE